MPRLDVLVTNSGLAESRERAQALILAGKVRVAGETVRRPDHAVSDDALAKVVASNLAVYGHPTSTVPMGARPIPGPSWTPSALVQGVDRLRVVDASIIPEVPSTVTNVTVIMLAERICQRAYA